MSWGVSLSSGLGTLGQAALTYAGLMALTDVVSAVGSGVANTIESVMPSGSYGRNNPSHLGSKIDTSA
jgi:hypothetical protein